jgi:hypothetical protein
MRPAPSSHRLFPLLFCFALEPAAAGRNRPQPMSAPPAFPRHDTFESRHLGPSSDELREILATLGCETLDQVTDKAIPKSIRWVGELETPPAKGEREALATLAALAAENRVLRSYIGLGYHGTLTPAVIQRNILESPGWYTQYTPYQAEISQGRLEALLNYQTLVLDLTPEPRFLPRKNRKPRLPWRVCGGWLFLMIRST